MAENKELKITTAVDQASLQKAVSSLRGLTQEVIKLSEALRQVDLSKLGGATTFQGGGGFGGAISTKSGITPMQQQAQRPGGIAGAMTQGLQTGIQQLKGMVTGTRDLFQSMSTGFKDSTSKQVQDIQRLSAALGNLEKRYASVSAAAGQYGAVTGGGLVDQFGRSIGGGVTSGGGSGDVGGGNTAPLGNQGPQPKRGGGTPGGGRPRLGPSSMNEYDPYEKDLQLSRLMPMGMVAGGVALAAAAAGKFTGAINNQFTGALAYQLERPFVRGEKNAILGDVFGGNAIAGWRGDITRGAAWSALARRGDERLKSAADWQTQTRMLIEQAGLGGHMSMGQLAGRMYEQSVGSWIGGKEGAMIPTMIAFSKAVTMNPAEQARKAQEAANQEIRQNAAYYENMQSVFSGAMGRVQAGRVGGFGGGDIKTGPFKGMDAQAVLDANLTAQGFSFAQLQASNRQVGAVAGWGARGGLGVRALTMQAGGLQGAENLFGVGLQFGQSTRADRFAGGNQMMAAVQAGIGAGGMDVTAGGQLATSIAQQLVGSGQFGFGNSGVPFMEGMLALGNTGSPGGDMRQSRLIQLGMTGLGNMYAGTTDKLQQGLNVSAANLAAPTENTAFKEALQQMTPAAMMGVIRSGVVPSNMLALANKGHDVRAEIAAMQQQRESTFFARNFASGLGISQAGETVALAKSMGLRNYLDSMGAAAGPKALEKAAGPLAAAMRAGMPSLTPEMALGMIETEYGGTAFAANKKGKGAQAAGMAERDKVGLAALRALKLNEEANISDPKTKALLLQDIAESPAANKEFLKTHKGLAAKTSGDGIDISSKSVSVELDKLATGLKEFKAVLDATSKAVKAYPKSH